MVLSVHMNVHHHFTALVCDPASWFYKAGRRQNTAGLWQGTAPFSQSPARLKVSQTIPPSIPLSIHQSIYLFITSCRSLSPSLAGLSVTSRRMRMSAFSGIYSPFPLCAQDLISPRSEVALCVFVWLGVGRHAHPRSDLT